MTVFDDIPTVDPGDWIHAKGATSTLAMTGFDGIAFMTPIILPRMVIVGFRLNVTSGGSAGTALLRAGLLNVASPARWTPGRTVIDAGTQAADAVAALVWTVAPTVWPGGPCFLCAIPQGGPAVGPTIRTVTDCEFYVPTPLGAALDSTFRFPDKTGIPGAMPSDMSPNSLTTFGPLMMVLAGDPRDVRPA